MKLQFSQLYANVSKVELSSIMSLHRGHSISVSSSVNTDSSFCSDGLDSFSISRTCFSDGFVLWRPSLALIHLDIAIIIKND
jgi:hypothetical protein